MFGRNGSKSPPPRNNTKKNKPTTTVNKPVHSSDITLTVGGTRRRSQSGGDWRNSLRAEIEKLEAMNAEINAKHRREPKYLLNAYRANRKTIRNMMSHALDAPTRTEAKERINAALKKSNELLSKYEK